MDHSVITCDEIIDADMKAKSIDEETKTIPTNFNEKYIICETKSFYILLTFLLITIALFIAFSIYYYLIVYRSNTKTFITISRHKQRIKGIDIQNRACYCFDDITKIEGFDFDNILIDEKS